MTARELIEILRGYPDHSEVRALNPSDNQVYDIEVDHMDGEGAFKEDWLAINLVHIKDK